MHASKPIPCSGSCKRNCGQFLHIRHTSWPYAGMPASAEAGNAHKPAGEAADWLPRSWRWWAMRVVVQQQRLLAGPAAALRAELQQLAPQVCIGCGFLGTASRLELKGCPCARTSGTRVVSGDPCAFNCRRTPRGSWRGKVLNALFSSKHVCRRFDEKLRQLMGAFETASTASGLARACQSVAPCKKL